MSELCFSGTSMSHLFRSRVKSDFFLFCSFILSHPLQFTFLIFFFPYIHKVLSFVFPLFITTSLFILAFLTFIQGNDKQSVAEGKVSSFTAVYRTCVELLRSKIDNQRVEYLRLEDFEVFRTVFENPTIVDADVVNKAEESKNDGSCQEASLESFNVSSPDAEEALASQTELESFAESESNWGDTEDADDKKLGSSWQDWYDDFEVVKAMNSSSSTVDLEKNAPSSTGTNKAILEEKKSQLSNGSEAAEAEAETGDNAKIRRNDLVGEEKGGDECYNKSKLLKVHSHSTGASADYTNDHGNYSLRVQSSPSLDYNYGSMRKEKEWKRTLACKLFEERHNNTAGAGAGTGDQISEGMDLLWETYESETSAAKNKANGKKKNKNGEKTPSKQNSKNKYEINVHEEELDEDDDDDESTNGQLCCLQALKFSTGKMNLGGMGRPNLVKFSKAIKGMGWLHSLKKHHSKKVHNGDKY